MLYRPGEVASQLGIAGSTLRLWSVRFAEELSEQASKASAESSGQWAQRRYTEEDLELLSKVKSLLAQGLTYQEVKRQLRASSRPPTTAPPRRPDAARPDPLPDGLEIRMAALQEEIRAKDKTIAALKESLAFLDTYLQTVRRERDDARERIMELESELQELREKVSRPVGSGAKSWLKQVISGM